MYIPKTLRSQIFLKQLFSRDPENAYSQNLKPLEALTRASAIKKGVCKNFTKLTRRLFLIILQFFKNTCLAKHL